MRDMSDEEFEKEWKNAEKCVEDLLVVYKEAGWDRRKFTASQVDATMMCRKVT